MNYSYQNVKILTLKEKLLLIPLCIGILGGFLNALPPDLLGFSSTALGWIIPSVACILITMGNLDKSTFPFLIWVPWILYTSICYLGASFPNAFQRLVMLHIAVVIGIAFSTIQPSNYFYEQFSKGINYYLGLILLTGFFAAGLFSGAINSSTGFAAGAITAALLAVWFAGKYSIGDKNGLYCWAALCFVPFLCNTRMGMLSVALTMPLTFGPLSLKKRLMTIVIILLLGLLAFQSERIQSKMFYSGSGDLIDAANGLIDLMSGQESEVGASDFATNGRKSIAIALKDGLNRNYWTGNGSNASESISMDLSGVSHPHNDWLRIQYEYGMLGIVIFISTVLMQIYHGWKMKQFLPRKFTPLFCISFGSFIPMAFFMLSDNILLYVAWFGNLQFAAMGIYYAFVAKFKVSPITIDQ